MQLVPHQIGACSKADSTNFKVGHSMIIDQGMRKEPACVLHDKLAEKIFSQGKKNYLNNC